MKKIKTIKKPQTKPASCNISILIHLALILLSSVIFTASFPNPVFTNGIPFLAFFAYIPILIVISKYNLPACIGWGAVYGLLTYSLFNYWLGAFHPMAGTIVYSIYMFYLAVTFLFLKLAHIFFPNKAYLVQWPVWLAYEYLRTTGFLGYPYGITGYSQWQVIPLIQIASVTGVWGVSALVTFPSFWIANLFNHEPHEQYERSLRFDFNSLRLKINKNKFPAIVWVIALISTLVFGFVSMKDFSAYPAANIALIQHNTDPWEASKATTPQLVYQAYLNDLTILTRLSDEALASHPKPQLVVWPETAFVPRIYWHLTYRDDPSSWILVSRLLDYLAERDVPFLIGNDDARKDPAINPNPAESFRIDYNAAILFEGGEISEIYRKLHLVPFTEHFPYQRQLPFMYEALRNADTHFWEKGTEATVFQGPGFTFSTPICFEDSFGYLSRKFVQSGADVIVNISNDAWANSMSSQMQHLSMAIFRAVENHRPMVRSTASGHTCAIDPNGRIIAEAPPFTEAWLNASIPLAKKDTLYTRYGDYLAYLFTFCAAALLLFGALRYIMGKLKEKK